MARNLLYYDIETRYRGEGDPFSAAAKRKHEIVSFQYRKALSKRRSSPAQWKVVDPQRFLKGGKSAVAAEKDVLQRVQSLISRDYAMIGWNSLSFDSPVVRYGFERHGLSSKTFVGLRQIDLMVEAQKHFKKLGISRPFSLRDFSNDLIDVVTEGKSDADAYLKQWNISKGGKGQIVLGSGEKLSGKDYWKALGTPSDLEKLKKYALRDVDLLAFIDEHLGLSANALDPSVSANTELMKRMRRYKHADSANEYFSYELNKLRGQYSEWERVHGKAAAIVSNKVSGRIQVSGEESLGTSYFSKWLREGSGGFRTGDVAWMVYDEQLAKELKLDRPVVGAQIAYKGVEYRFDFRSQGQREEYASLARRVAEEIGDEQAIKEMDARMEAGLKAWKERISSQKVKGDIASAGTAKALNAAENITPSGLDDYVSSAVAAVGKSSKQSTLTRVAPYAMAALAGADILASRDKTGPFWGMVAGGGAFFMTRKMATLPRAGVVGASYALARMIAGSLSKSHSGSLPGFEEGGEAAISRKQLTDFGSGWNWKGSFRVLSQWSKETLSSLGNVFRKSSSQGPKAILGYKNVRPSMPVKSDIWSHEPEGLVSGPRLNWFNKMCEPYTKAGIQQAAEIEAQKAAGTYYKNLPVIPREPPKIFFEGTPRTKTAPTMQFSREEAAKTLASYAEEKNIQQYRNYWISTENISPKFGKTFGSMEFRGEKVLTPRPDVAISSRNLQAETSRKFSPGAVEERLHVEKEALLAHQTVAQEILGRLEQRGLVVQRKARTSVIDFNTARQSSIDSHYRSKHPDIEGFTSTGVSGGRRKIETDFGTGWDAARSVARNLGIRAKGSKVYEALAKHDEWITALKSAEKIKALGAGGFGSADLMETTIRGKKFRFVRKTAREGTENVLSKEVATLRAGEGSRAASVYKYDGGNEILMEYIEGQSLRDFMKSGGTIQKSQVRQLKKAVKHLHRKGTAHSDLNARNIMVTNEGKIAYIDPSYKERMSDFARVAGLPSSSEMLHKITKAQDDVQLNILQHVVSPGREVNWTKSAEGVSNRLVAVSNASAGLMPIEQFSSHEVLKHQSRRLHVSSAREIMARVGVPAPFIEHIAPLPKRVKPAKPISPPKPPAHSGVPSMNLRGIQGRPPVEVPVQAPGNVTLPTGATPIRRQAQQAPPNVTLPTGAMPIRQQARQTRAVSSQARENLHSRAADNLHNTMNPVRQSRSMSAATGGSRDQSISLATADLKGLR